MVAFRIGGVNEASARFFPALFGWATVLVAAAFFAKLLGRAAGLLTGFILCSSWLFCTYHAGRSGEADSTLIFFSLLTFIALWHARRSARWFYVAAVFTALAWMSKGSTAYLPWVAAALASVSARPTWRWRHALGGAGVAFALTLPWQLAMLARHGAMFARAFYVGEGALPAACPFSTLTSGSLSIMLMTRPPMIRSWHRRGRRRLPLW